MCLIERKEVFEQTKDQNKALVTEILITKLSIAIVSNLFNRHLVTVPCASKSL